MLSSKKFIVHNDLLLALLNKINAILDGATAENMTRIWNVTNVTRMFLLEYLITDLFINHQNFFCLLLLLIASFLVPKYQCMILFLLLVGPKFGGHIRRSGYFEKHGRWYGLRRLFLFGLLCSFYIKDINDDPTYAGVG